MKTYYRKASHKKDNRYQPTGWQLDPQSVKTNRVQLWRHGNMMTAQLKLIEARTLIENGSAFVISDQAIGSMSNGFSEA